jgi:hypothetical protein
MKKLQLDTLKVDSFATTSGIDAMRGTVAGYSAQCTIIGCPISHRVTCEITCQSCDTDVPCR